MCSQLFCFDAKSGYCVSYRPAAEGSPCGDGKVCNQLFDARLKGHRSNSQTQAFDFNSSSFCVVLVLCEWQVCSRR